MRKLHVTDLDAISKAVQDRGPSPHVQEIMDEINKLKLRAFSEPTPVAYRIRMSDDRYIDVPADCVEPRWEQATT